ncbi:orotidine-5'-phosphate decarboxylase [Candidatus Nomurabacteria bacterium]|nr:orotidine-5'-phosphate decarboxylase [Candidatus Nomurabacteria bacterium]
MSRPTFTSSAKRIMVAIDVDELSEAKKIAENLKDLGVTFKIGNQLGTYEGWQKAVEFARQYGAQIFCDTKFKDIPNTVEKSARAITRRQPDFFNVMADNNLAALVAAVDGTKNAVEDFSLASKPIILGVTVLTSINSEESDQIYGDDPASKVLQFASNAAKAGLDGVVCSAEEVTILRSDKRTSNLILVTPGIRPSWAAPNDQARIITPSQAVKNGSDYLVIGRPITQPPKDIGSPRDAVLKIIEELDQVK